MIVNMNNEEKGGGEKKHYIKDPTCPFLSHKLPPDLNEVAYVIAKVYKYGNIDDYAEKLIREDIEKRRKNDDIDDSFKGYLKKMLSSSPTTADSDSDNNNDDAIELIPITLRLKKNFAQVLRLLAKHFDDEDIDKFTSEEVSKIILALSDHSAVPSMSDELNQHIQKLLLEEEEEEEEEK
jgi:hypothetical protein